MAKQGSQQDEQNQDVGMTTQIGIVQVNWPQTIGYYGGIGMALAAELIEPPFAVFIAAIPIFKMLSHPILPKPARIAGQLLEGAAKPVGGSDEATVQLVNAGKSARSQKSGQQPSKRPSVWQEARALVDRQHTMTGTSTDARKQGSRIRRAAAKA
jgi:hypothetical protein